MVWLDAELRLRAAEARARLLTRAGRSARGLVPGMRRVAAQVEPYAQYWREHNARVLDSREAGSRLWVAVGDSTAQGVGASAPDRGFVGQLLEMLGAGWQVVNLSRSGIRLQALRAELVPELAALASSASLVTVTVGANDLIPTPLARITHHLGSLLEELPAGAVVATVPQGLRPAKAAAFNDLVRTRAPDLGLRVADVWAHTGPPWRGKFASDGFHPNDGGYRHWTDAFAEALGLHPDTEDPLRDG